MDDINIVLSCGFNTLYKNLKEKPNEIECFVCESHKLNIKECLSMPINELNLKLKEQELEMEYYNNAYSNFEIYKKDPCFFINQSLEKVKNDLNLRREELKLEFNHKIDKYYDQLYEKVEKEFKSKKCKYEKTVKYIEAEIKKLDDKMSFKVKIEQINENLKELKKKIILMNESIEELKNETIQFDKTNTVDYLVNIEQIFGKLKFEIKNEMRYKLSDEINTDLKISDLKLFKNNQAIVGSVDGIFLFDLNTKTCTKTFLNQKKTYNLCLLNKNHFASSHDLSIKIWDFNSIDCIRELKVASKVDCLKIMKNGILTSGHSNGYIVKWNYNNDYSYNQFEAHKQAILCLEESFEGKLISGSHDSTIKVWDENTNCIKTLRGHKNCVSSLKILNGKMLASGSYDKTLKFWDLEIGTEIISIDNNSIILDLEIITINKLVSISKDGSIKIWNTDSVNCLKTFENKNIQIFGVKIALNENKDIICGFSDGTIKIFKS